MTHIMPGIIKLFAGNAYPAHKILDGLKLGEKQNVKGSFAVCYFYGIVYKADVALSHSRRYLF